MPFTISLINTTYKQGMDFKDIPLTTNAEKLQALIHLAVIYMRKLRITNNRKDVRNLPEKHPLKAYFDRIKPIMRNARKTRIEKRPKLVKQFYEVLKEFWDTTQNRERDGNSLDNALSNTQPEIKIILTRKDAKKLKQILERSGTMQKVAGVLKRAAICIAAHEVAEEKRKDEQAAKRIHEQGELGSKISEENTDISAEPVKINMEIV